MIRVFNVYFPARTLVLGASELVLIYLAFTMAVIARAGRDADLVLADERGLWKIALVTVVYLLCMYYLDLYDSKILSNRHQVLTRALQVMGLGSVILAIVYYAYPSAELGRGTFFLGVLFALPFIILWRELFSWLVAVFHLAEKTLVIGHGALATALCREMTTRSEFGLDVVGRIDVPDDQPSGGETRHRGTLEELKQMVDEHHVTRVIVAMSDRRGRLPVDDLLSLKAKGVVVQDGADLYENMTGKLQLDTLRPGWLLFSPGFCPSRSLLMYKRLFSFVLSLLSLVVSGPLFILIAIAVRLDSKGPAIFSQQRVGKNGKLFYLYKFRTMVDAVNTTGVHQPAQDDDERITRVGRWLRRARLDEMPQLYNILIGDMDYVGPRPFVPDQEEECARKIPLYRQRWSVLPGVTGWAQTNHGYCATLEDNFEKAAYDLYYIKHMSIGMDLLILFQTVKTVLLGRGSR